MSTLPFVIFGPPGSGKGTQSKELVKKHPKWTHVSTGDLFRAELASGSELGLSVKETLAEGKLVSDEVTNQVFKSQVRKILKAKSCEVLILDGYPRNGAQSQELCSFVSEETTLAPALCLELSLSEEEVLKRLSNRRVNPRTGKIYHLIFNPPKVKGLCDDDGQALIRRDDDQDEVILSRYQLYQRQKESVFTELKKHYEVRELNGDQDISFITQKIEEVILEHLDKN